MLETLQDYMDTGLEFHGHRCPAMPMGLRAGLAARAVLGVERSRDKELVVIAETGKGHAAGCFLDGLMTATGCTYGKANIEKLYYNKLAFTLIDTKSGRAVRISVKPEFLKKALNSPFVQKRKEGVPPQDVAPEIAEPLIEKVLNLSDSDFLDIGEVHPVEIEKKKGVFDAEVCSICGELTFVNKLVSGDGGKLVCIPCSESK